MTREEALSHIKSVWNMVEYEWGPSELNYTKLDDVLTAIGCTPEEIAAPIT
jgi:hypothetical protein